MKSLMFIAILSLLLVGVFVSGQRASETLNKRESEKAPQQVEQVKDQLESAAQTGDKQLETINKQ